MRQYPALVAAALAFLAAPASARERTVYGAAQLLYEGVFDPERHFSGDLELSTDDQLVLTATASARDDYAPAYSLAIAYDCYGRPDGCRYIARTLRLGPFFSEDTLEKSFALLERVREAETSADVRAALDATRLEWLEADLERCDGGIAAMDSVRVADWRPDVHFALVPVEEREVILHPAEIRVRMTGSYSTSRYTGWVLAPGVPAAIRKLLETLEPCWKPSRTRPPWRRSAPRRRAH